MFRNRSDNIIRYLSSVFIREEEENRLFEKKIDPYKK